MRLELRALVVCAAASGAAGGGAVPDGGEPKRGFVQNLTKSIRDFGFGKRSLVEGGVGLFVFTGIGKHCGPRQAHLRVRRCGKPGACAKSRIVRGRSSELNDVSCNAGVALMLVSWARGGSLFSRGRGYNVRPYDLLRSLRRRNVLHRCLQPYKLNSLETHLSW